MDDNVTKTPDTPAFEGSADAATPQIEVDAADSVYDDLGTLPASDSPSVPTADEDTVPSTDGRDEVLPEIDGYEFVDVLGRGGMGVVYRAKDVNLERDVAIKMVLAGSIAGSSMRDRFDSEARAVAQLQHTHIAQLYTASTFESRPYFVMEYVSGGTLAHRIRGNPLSPRDAAAMIVKLAEGVDFSHRQGIIHRDLKPGNVLLTEAGEPKIADFGLAKWIDSDSGSTKTGDIIGTPSYMAPEQAGGVVRNIGPPCDIYALGAILYELLTGRPPFRTPEPLQTVMLVLSEDPVPPRKLQPTVSRDLETICLKCLEKSPDKRYETAGALAADLQRFLRDEPIIARPVGRVERLAKWVKRRPATATIVALVFLGLVGALAGAVYHSRQMEDALAETESQRDKFQRERDRAEGLVVSVKSERDNVDRERKRFKTERDRAERLVVQVGRERDNVKAERNRFKRERDRAEKLVIAVKAERDKVKQQRDRATRLFDAGQGLSKSLLEEHLTELEQLAGGLVVQEKLAKRLVAYLDKLSTDAEDDSVLLADLADWYERVAKVQGNPYEENRGDSAEALKNYRKALAFREKLLSKRPNALLPQLQYAICRKSIADVQFQRGKVSEARAEFEDVLKFLKKLRKDNPKENRVLAAIIEVMGGLADADEWAAKLPEALKRYRSALKLCDEFIPRTPKKVAVHKEIRNLIHLRIGELLEKSTKTDEAETHFLNVYAHRKKLYDTFPANAKHQMRYGSILIKLADIEIRRRKFEAARKLFLKALPIYRVLADAERENDSVHGVVAQIYSRVGFSYLQEPTKTIKATAEKGVPHLLEAHAIRKRLADEAPVDIERQHNLGVVERQLSTAYSRTQEYDKAEKYSRAALATAARNEKLVPNDPFAMELRAECHMNLGVIEAQRGMNAAVASKMEAAKKHFDLCLKYFSRSQSTWKEYDKRHKLDSRTRQLSDTVDRLRAYLEMQIKKVLKTATKKTKI